MAKLFKVTLNWRQWIVLLIGIVRISILFAAPPYYDDSGLFGSINYVPVDQIPPDAQTDPDVNAQLLRQLIFFTVLDIAIGLLLYRSDTNIWQEVIAATWSVTIVGITMGLGEWLGLSFRANLIVCGLALVATLLPMARADRPQRNGRGLAGVITICFGLGLYLCALFGHWFPEWLAVLAVVKWIPMIRGASLAFALVGSLLSLSAFRTRIGKTGLAVGLVVIVTWLVSIGL
jgi:hypothetical protein